MRTFAKVCLLYLCLCTILYLCLSTLPLIEIHPDHVAVSDFIQHVGSVRGFWRGEVKNIYDIFELQKYWSGIVGGPVSFFPPIGFTPVGVYLLVPFSYLFQVNNALAQALWFGIGLTLFLCVIWKARSYVDSLALLYLLTGILFCSYQFGVTFLLGQSSLLALSLLAYLLHSSIGQRSSAVTIAQALALALLAMKPQYYFLGAVILISNRRFLSVLASLVPVLLCLGMITIQIGSIWLSTYLHTLSSFTASQLPPGYFRAFNPGYLNIFRSAFFNIYPPEALELISKIVSAGSLLLVGVMSIVKGLGFGLKTLSTEFLFSFGLCSYLLFAPYVGNYEDLILFLPFLFVIARWDYRGSRVRYSILAIELLCLVICYNFLLIFPSDYLVRWLVKFALLTSLVLQCHALTPLHSERSN